MVRVVGIDPGLANCGIAVAEADANEITVREAFVVSTESQSKKLRVHVSHDSIRRAKELADVLASYIGNADIVAMEGISLPRHASSAGKLCLSFGVIAALCEIRQVPLVQFSPQEVKKFFPNGKTKEPRVEWALLHHHDLMARLPLTKREHAADAIGICYLATRDDYFRLLVAALRLA